MLGRGNDSRRRNERQLDAVNAGRLASARRWITSSKGAIIWFERFLALAISDLFLIGA
jgi:hypothetical protein